MPVFDVIGKKITHVGDSGAGQIAKACNQVMVAAQMVAMGELLILARKAGASPEKVVAAIQGGAAQCWTLDVKPERLFAGNRNPGFKAYMQAKDLGIVMDTAREYGIPAVMSVRGVMRMLDDGDEIVVDGDDATVSRIGFREPKRDR